MLLSINIDQLYDNYIILCDPIKNTVIEDSKFIRIIFSNNMITTNGIYVNINLLDLKIENSYNNKYKCSFDSHKNYNNLKNIYTIENMILSKFDTNKIKSFKIRDSIDNGIIKIFNENNRFKNIILKISGIWENDYEYGLTYKFITP
tara:strand:+ start:665 stop:1105 length:441 start_codon:yes stop_codon:yes gene_type:complete